MADNDYKIAQKVDDAIVTEVAVGLQKHWQFIDGFLDKDPKAPAAAPTSKDFEAMARQAVAKEGTFTWAGKPQSLDAIKGKASKAFAESPEIQEQMTDIDVDIPSAEQRKKITSAIEQGIKDNTGFMSNIMHFIKGLMSWVAGFFNGENKEKDMGLWDHVNRAASAPIADAARQNLAELGKKEGITALQDAGVLDQMASQIASSVRNKDKPEDQQQTTTVQDILALEGNKPIDMNQRAKEAIAETVRDRMDHDFIPTLNAEIDKQGFFARKFAHWRMPKDTIKDVVADATLDVVTNPEKVFESQADMQTALTDTIKSALDTDKRLNGTVSGGILDALTDDTKQKIAESTAAKVSENYLAINAGLKLMGGSQVASVGAAISGVDQARQLADQERAIAQNAGVVGGQNTDMPLAAMTGSVLPQNNGIVVS